jgi:hypothetical protein
MSPPYKNQPSSPKAATVLSVTAVNAIAEGAISETPSH